MNKTRVLAWGDYACSTGFGTVMKNIMSELHKSGQYEIDVVGVNYDGGPYDTKKWPGTLWPAISALRTQGPYGDVFGRQVFLDLLAQRPYDLVFIVQDTFIVLDIVTQITELQNTKPGSFKTIYYYPFDCGPRLLSVLLILTTLLRILNTLRMKVANLLVNLQMTNMLSTMELISKISLLWIN